MDDSIISVFLVDDHPIVRSGLKSELNKNENIQLIGEASSGKEALERIPKLSPDVVLMDISIPDMTGLEITERIMKKMPNAKIIALTMHHNEDYVLEMIRLGAMGYVMKDADPAELINAINEVYNNKRYYSSTIQDIVLKKHAEMIKKAKKSFIEKKLTPREFDVLIFLVNGFSNKEIAKKLFLSVRTVESHRERIMQKLNIKSVAGLTKFAIAEGLLKV